MKNIGLMLDNIGKYIEKIHIEKNILKKMTQSFKV